MSETRGIEEYTTSGGAARWRVPYRRGGKRRSLSFTSLDSARHFKRLYDQHGADRALTYYDSLDATAVPLVTVEAALERYLTNLNRPSPATIHHYRLQATRSWLPALGELAVQTVTRDDVTAWVKARQRTASQETTRQELGRLTSVMADCVTRGEIHRNPAHGIEFKRKAVPRPKVITRDQFDNLVAEFTEPRDQHLVHLLGATGMRWSEAIALRWIDVDLDARVLNVAQAFKRGSKGAPARQLGEPKTPRSTRTVTLYADTVQHLTEQRTISAAHPSGLVFPGKGKTDDGSPRGINPTWWMKTYWHPARERAGLPRTVTPHVLRHSHISWLLAAGAPSKIVAWRVGHETSAVTEKVYAHWIPDAALLTDEYVSRVMASRQTPSLGS